MKGMVFAVFCSFFLLLTASGVSAMMLLAEEEAALADKAPSGEEAGQSPLTLRAPQPVNNGPEVKIIKPGQTGEYNSPVEIEVSFEAKGGTEVDIAKLKVECLKFVTINLTDRVLPYASKKGIKIQNAELPKGEHKIRVTIGDVKGGMTRETFLVKVM